MALHRQETPWLLAAVLVFVGLTSCSGDDSLAVDASAAEAATIAPTPVTTTAPLSLPGVGPTSTPSTPPTPTAPPATSAPLADTPEAAAPTVEPTPDEEPATAPTEGEVSSEAVEPVEPAATATPAPALPTATREPVRATIDAADRPAAPNGRTAPLVATTAAGLAEQLATAESLIRDPASDARTRADWGHTHQLAIRALGYRPDWDIEFFQALPAELQSTTLLQIGARRALIDLKSGYSAADFVPAWQIVEPESADALLAHYREAEGATGIEWEYLAAINLIETGMGRIRGLSSAGAQGPMQFLPTTWNESGIGAGDINDPHDAIQAAARYLVRRGGPGDMAGAIWGYNNSDDYVTAVQAYAELLRRDPTAFEAIYNWEIYFYTEAGDVWLPTGFRTEETLDLADFLAANPWSSPDAGVR